MAEQDPTLWQARGWLSIGGRTARRGMGWVFIGTDYSTAAGGRREWSWEMYEAVSSSSFHADARHGANWTPWDYRDQRLDSTKVLLAGYSWTLPSNVRHAKFVSRVGRVTQHEPD